MAEELIPNKVEQSGLVTISLEDYYIRGVRKHIDIAPWLYEGIMLREKDFRQYLKEHNWESYQDCYVSVNCSVDAIIPQWAYMLVSNALSGIARHVVLGTEEQLEILLIEKGINDADLSDLIDKRVIVKGCGDLIIPSQGYISLTQRLQPIVKSLMFGEACSTVPVYKRK